MTDTKIIEIIGRTQNLKVEEDLNQDLNQISIVAKIGITTITTNAILITTAEIIGTTERKGITAGTPDLAPKTEKIRNRLKYRRESKR